MDPHVKPVNQRDPVPEKRPWIRALPFISIGLILIMVIFAIVAIAGGDTGTNGVNIFFLATGLFVLLMRGAVLVAVGQQKRARSATELEAGHD